MALTYDQISAITEKKFIPKMVDNIFNQNALLKKLKAKEKPQSGGDKVIVPLEYAQASAAGWYQGAETVDTTDNEVITAAEFEWKQLYANISITRRDELRNSGDAAKVNFVMGKVSNAEKTIRDTLNTGLFNDGSDSKQIQGLGLAVNTTGTYGGIAHGSYSWWNGQVDSSTTTLTLSAMQGIYGDAGEGSEYPNLLVSDQDMFDRYWNLLQPQQRFADEEMGKGGFKSLLFNGQPFVVDASCGAGDLYMLNLDYLDLYPHKDENFRFEKFIKPINQNVKLAKVYWMGVLASSNNRRHGLLGAITA
ncbi:MAG: phage major capsid protein, partial [Candidatus Thorarchaeota archaeon]